MVKNKDSKGVAREFDRVAAARELPSTARGRERYARIVAAAEQLFAERDYHDVSINEIVRISGGSLATIYKWFGGKDELLYAILLRRIQFVQETIARYSFSGASLDEDLSGLVDSFAVVAPLQLVRTTLFYSALFQRYSREVTSQCAINIIAPLARLFDDLSAKWGVRFKLDSHGMAMTIVRYMRGFFVEVALDGEIVEEASRASADLKQILNALKITK